MPVELCANSSTDAWKHVFCTLCGPSETTGLLEQAPYRLVSCNGCGLVFMTPQPPNIGEAGLVTEDRLEFLLKEHKRVRHLWCRESLAWVHRYTQGGRLMDIGCSAGFFLHAAQDAGWHVSGIEPSRVMTQYAQKELGLAVIQGRLDETTVNSFDSESYDVITMWEVLEHLHTPSEGLQLTKKLLSPEGFLFLQVPNIESPVFRIFGKKWHNLSIQCHATFFSPRTLRTLLARCGYYVKTIFSHSHIYRKVGPWRIRGIPLDSDLRFTRALTMVFTHWLFKITGVGDQIVAVAKKAPAILTERQNNGR